MVNILINLNLFHFMFSLVSGKESVNSGHTYVAAALQFQTATNHEGALI